MSHRETREMLDRFKKTQRSFRRDLKPKKFHPKRTLESREIGAVGNLLGRTSLSDLFGNGFVTSLGQSLETSLARELLANAIKNHRTNQVEKTLLHRPNSL